MRANLVFKILIGVLTVALIATGIFFWTSGGVESPPALQGPSGLQGYFRNFNNAIAYDDDDVDDYDIECTAEQEVPFLQLNNGIYFTEDVTVGEIVNEFVVPEDGLQLDFAYYSTTDTEFKSFGGIWTNTGPLTESSIIPAYTGVVFAPDREGIFCDLDGIINTDQDFLAAGTVVPEPLGNELGGWILAPSSINVGQFITDNEFADRIKTFWAIEQGFLNYRQLEEDDQIDAATESSLVWFNLDQEDDPVAPSGKTASINISKSPQERFTTLVKGETLDIFDVEISAEQQTTLGSFSAQITTSSTDSFEDLDVTLKIRQNSSILTADAELIETNSVGGFQQHEFTLTPQTAIRVSENFPLEINFIADVSADAESGQQYAFKLLDNDVLFPEDVSVAKSGFDIFSDPFIVEATPGSVDPTIPDYTIVITAQEEIENTSIQPGDQDVPMFKFTVTSSINASIATLPFSASTIAKFSQISIAEDRGEVLKKIPVPENVTIASLSGRVAPEEIELKAGQARTFVVLANIRENIELPGSISLGFDPERIVFHQTPDEVIVTDNENNFYGSFYLPGNNPDEGGEPNPNVVRATITAGPPFNYGTVTAASQELEMLRFTVETDESTSFQTIQLINSTLSKFSAITVTEGGGGNSKTFQLDGATGSSDRLIFNKEEMPLTENRSKNFFISVKLKEGTTGSISLGIDPDLTKFHANSSLITSDENGFSFTSAYTTVAAGEITTTANEAGLCSQFQIASSLLEQEDASAITDLEAGENLYEISLQSLPDNQNENRTAYLQDKQVSLRSQNGGTFLYSIGSTTTEDPGTTSLSVAELENTTLYFIGNGNTIVSNLDGCNFALETKATEQSEDTTLDEEEPSTAQSSPLIEVQFLANSGVHPFDKQIESNTLQLGTGIIEYIPFSITSTTDVEFTSANINEVTLGISHQELEGNIFIDICGYTDSPSADFRGENCRRLSQGLNKGQFIFVPSSPIQLEAGTASYFTLKITNILSELPQEEGFQTAMKVQYQIESLFFSDSAVPVKYKLPNGLNLPRLPYNGPVLQFVEP